MKELTKLSSLKVNFQTIEMYALHTLVYALKRAERYIHDKTVDALYQKA